MSTKKVCPQCGDSAEGNQKFCEKCGAPIPAGPGGPVKTQSAQTTRPTGQAAKTTQMPSQSTGGLFDPSRTTYVIKEKFWDWGSGPIYDASGQQIGKMHRKVLSIRKRIEFQEMDGKIVASIAQKLIAIKPTYDLHDSDDRLIGRFSKTLFSFLRPKFELKDPTNGQIILSAQGKVFGFDFEIFKGDSKDPKNKVAEVHKADKWRDVFFAGGWDFSDTYGVKVVDPTINRKLLLGFVITIDNVLFDK